MNAEPHSVACLLTDLDRLGVELLADGDRLRYRPQGMVDSQLQRRLARHKAELMGVLTEAPAVGCPSPWAQRAAVLVARVDDERLRVLFRDLFEERTAVCEIDGGLSMAEADHVAYEELRAMIDSASKSIGECCINASIQYDGAHGPTNQQTGKDPERRN